MIKIECYFYGIIKPYAPGGFISYSYKITQGNKKLVKVFTEGKNVENDYLVADSKALLTLLSHLKDVNGSEIEICFNNNDLMRAISKKFNSDQKPYLVIVSKINKAIESATKLGNSFKYVLSYPDQECKKLAETAINKMLTKT